MSETHFIASLKLYSLVFSVWGTGSDTQPATRTRSFQSYCKLRSLQVSLIRLVDDSSGPLRTVLILLPPQPDLPSAQHACPATSSDTPPTRTRPCQSHLLSLCLLILRKTFLQIPILVILYIVLSLGRHPI